MGADYSFYMKSIVTFVLTFFWYIISVLASVKGYYFMLWLSFGLSLTFYLNLPQHTVHEDFNHHILVLSVGVAINAFIIILLHVWGCSKYCGRNKSNQFVVLTIFMFVLTAQKTGVTFLLEYIKAM